MSPLPCRLSRRAHVLVVYASLLLVVSALVDLDPARGARLAVVKGDSAPSAEVVPHKGDGGIPVSLAELAQDSIGRREYKASRNDRGLQAPNRAHDLRAYFEPWGVRVDEQTATEDPKLFRIKTVAIGRDGQRGPLGNGKLRVVGSRVENRRDRGLVEWYENGEAGLEHGHELDRRPTGDGSLRIDVAFECARVSVTDGRALIESANCPGPSIACVPASGSTFAVGTTTVTCTATDAGSNTGTCDFSVAVSDTQALSCPANIQTIALTPSGRLVNYTMPMATDNCGSSAMCAPASGSTFAIGTTTVTCTATDAANNATNCQFSVEVAPLGTDTPGIYVPATGSWFLRNDNSSGAADVVFGYGPAGIGWLPLEGDWDGNGTDTVGLYDPVNGNFFLKNTNSAGNADLVYGFGPAGLGWVPLVGDWDGDGVDTVGLYDPVNGTFFLRNAHAPGAADLVYGYGPVGLGLTPLPGNFDGNSSNTIALYDPVNGTFFVKNSHGPGPADVVYGFGPAGLGWKPLSGDWNGDGSDTIGLYDPASGNFFLRNTHAPGPADVFFGYGPANTTPITGDWNGM